MNIYHCHDILDWHVDHSRCTHIEEAPDLHSSVKGKVKDVLWELNRVDYEDPIAAENSVDDAIRLLVEFEKDIPEEMSDYIGQSNAVQGVVNDMGYSALSAYNNLNLLEKYIKHSGADTPVISEILSRVYDLRQDMNDVFVSHSTKLSAMQEAVLWIPSEIACVNTLLGTTILYLDVIPEDSTVDRMVFGKDDWIRYDGRETIDLYLPERISLNRYYISTFPKGDRCSHLWTELNQHFEDWTNPTPNELAVYTMATEKVWDILDWHPQLLEKVNDTKR